MRQPFEIDEPARPLTVTASIGIAIGDRDTAEDLLRDADVALYQAKAAGKNRYESSDPRCRRASSTASSSSSICARRLRATSSASSTSRSTTSRPHPGRRRSAAALGPPHPRPRPARRVHPAARTDRPDPRGRPLGARGRPASRWRPGAREATRSRSRSTSPPGSSTTTRSSTTSATPSCQRSRSPRALTIEVTETALMRDVDATARRLQRDQGARRPHRRSTTSAPATPRSPTSSSSRSTAQDRPLLHQRDQSHRSEGPDRHARPARQGDLGLKTLAEGVEQSHELDLLKDEQSTAVRASCSRGRSTRRARRRSSATGRVSSRAVRAAAP